MYSELQTANTNNCTGTLFSVMTHVTLHRDHFIWWQTSWCCPLFLLAVSCPDVIVDCITVNMRFLLNHILYGFWNWFPLARVYSLHLPTCSLHVKVLLVKVRMLHFACFHSHNFQGEDYYHVCYPSMCHACGRVCYSGYAVAKSTLSTGHRIVFSVNCCTVMGGWGLSFLVSGQVFRK